MKKILIYCISIYANQIFSLKNETFININPNKQTSSNIRVPNENNYCYLRNEKFGNNYSHNLNKNGPIFKNSHIDNHDWDFMNKNYKEKKSAKKTSNEFFVLFFVIVIFALQITLMIKMRKIFKH